MDSGGHQVTSGELASTSIGALIVSEVRFLRQCLAEILAHNSDFRVCGESASLTDALFAIQALRPDIVLLDVGFPGGFGTVPKFVCLLPQIKVVALAIAETEENVLGWVDAGVAGYVPNTATIDELLSLLVQISRGEQTCPARITGCLMRRVAAGGGGREDRGPVSAADPPGIPDLAAHRRGAQQQGDRAEPTHKPRDHEVACAQHAWKAEPSKAR
jgi:two-component system nitrate/nitrite response regulator NarL